MEERIKEIVLKYIKDPQTIILAVSQANIDIANSESLMLAKEFDEQGQRTIGVLSKIDI